MAKQKEIGLIIPDVFKIGDTEINKVTLITQRDEDVKLVINGISDITGYKSAVALRAIYRTTRTTLEKYRKEISAPHQDFVKNLKKVTDELGEIAYQGEVYFDDLLTAIDNEKERLKQEALMVEARRIQIRINELNKLGCQFDGEIYSFAYDVDLAIDTIGIKEATEDIWEHFLGDVKFAFDDEHVRLANVKLQEETDEIERLAEIERNKELAEQNKQQSTALDEKRMALRIKELKLLGAVVNENGDYNVPIEKGGGIIYKYLLIDLSDVYWDLFIEPIENYTPYVEPEKEVTVDISEFAKEFEDEIVASDVALGDHVNSFADQFVNEEPLIDESDYTIVKLVFDDEERYINFDISGKLKMRLWPDAYRDDAMIDGTVENYGKVQSLNWAIISKGGK